MDITVVAVSAIATGSAVLLGAFSAWLRYRAGREVRAGWAGRADQLEPLAAELRALRVSLEAVAVEVERLGEGQRYATRLLQERPDGSRADATTAARVVTPH